MPLTPETWLNQFQVNTTIGNVSNANVVQLSNGTMLVTWDSNVNTGAGAAPGTDVIGQLYDIPGNPIGGEFHVNGGFTADDERDASIAATTQGGFITVFEDVDSGNDSDIRMTVRDASGAPLFTTAIVADNTNSSPNFRDPVVAVSSSTSSLVVWIEDNGSGNDQVNYRLFNPATNALSAETLLFVNITGSGTIVGLSTDVLSNGSYVIAAQSNNAAGHEIWFKTVTATGTSGTVFQIPVTEGNNENDADPNVAALSGGGFVVVWENTDSNDTDVLFQIYSNAGVMQSGTIAVGSLGPSDDHNEAVAVALNDGGFLIIYDDDDSSGLRVQNYSATGSSRGSSFEIAAVNATGIEAVTLGDGRVMITRTNASSGRIEAEIIDTRNAAQDGNYSPDEFIVGTIGNDTFTANENGAAYGHDGNDNITDGGGIQDIYGGAGNDTINLGNTDASESYFGGSGT